MTHEEIEREFEKRFAYNLESSGAKDAAVHALWIVAPILIAQGIREAIEVIDASEGDVDYAKFKLRRRIEEVSPK
ncbi:MAG: hypothetical protein EHM33_00490 [Chloroflexi bacterium]|nr:MAG: hypothetical protein EHM33_00490 [Chloroflexota bacterium]